MKTIHEEEGYEPSATREGLEKISKNNSEVQHNAVRKTKSLPPNNGSSSAKVNGFHKILPGEASSKLPAIHKKDKNR